MLVQISGLQDSISFQLWDSAEDSELYSAKFKSGDLIKAKGMKLQLKLYGQKKDFFIVLKAKFYPEGSQEHTELLGKVFSEAIVEAVEEVEKKIADLKIEDAKPIGAPPQMMKTTS